MMIEKLQHELGPLKSELYQHPIYQNVQSLDHLDVFMSHHVFAVWDFMSLVKFLQHHFAPAGAPWRPGKHKEIIHFINDIVLEEESDVTQDGRYMSHFEMYLFAMEEMGFSTATARDFVASFSFDHFRDLCQKLKLAQFLFESMAQTFAFLDPQKPHLAAAAFCFGRENIIPHMFQNLLDQMSISEYEAPTFHYYLSRHIQLDGEVHGPMALKMVETLCGDNELKWQEATEVAKTAICARIKLWDHINAILQPQLANTKTHHAHLSFLS